MDLFLRHEVYWSGFIAGLLVGAAMTVALLTARWR